MIYDRNNILKLNDYFVFFLNLNFDFSYISKLYFKDMLLCKIFGSIIKPLKFTIVLFI